jgi:hypothetical protein
LTRIRKARAENPWKHMILKTMSTISRVYVKHKIEIHVIFKSVLFLNASRINNA